MNPHPTDIPTPMDSEIEFNNCRLSRLGLWENWKRLEREIVRLTTERNDWAKACECEHNDKLSIIQERDDKLAELTAENTRLKAEREFVCKQIAILHRGGHVTASEAVFANVEANKWKAFSDELQSKLTTTEKELEILKSKLQIARSSETTGIALHIAEQDLLQANSIISELTSALKKIEIGRWNIETQKIVQEALTHATACLKERKE